jgi:hypothetical protein
MSSGSISLLWKTSPIVSLFPTFWQKVNPHRQGSGVNRHFITSGIPYRSRQFFIRDVWKTWI